MILLLKLVFLFALLVSGLYVLLTFFLAFYEKKRRQVPLATGGWKQFLVMAVWEWFCTFIAVLSRFVTFVYRKKWIIQGKDPRKHIIFLHGFMHNPTAWWLIIWKLKKSYPGSLHALSFKPFTHSIKHHAEMVSEYLASLEGECILIGHSMGGVVAAYAAEFTKEKGKISKVITIGSPLQGTNLAYFNSCPSCQEIRPGSRLLSDLKRKISWEPSVEYFHVGSRWDNIISPAESALFPQHPDKQLWLQYHGHLALLYSKKVLSSLKDWVS